MGMALRMTQKATGLDAGVRSLASGIKGAASGIREATGSVVAYAQKKANLRNIERQLTKTVRRNPLQTMLAVTAIGFVGGMLIRRR